MNSGEPEETLLNLTPGSARMLSRLLFEAREQLSMWADVVEGSAGRRDAYIDSLIARVDLLRRAQGWSPHGFGHEAGTQ